MYLLLEISFVVNNFIVTMKLLTEYTNRDIMKVFKVVYYEKREFLLQDNFL